MEASSSNNNTVSNRSGFRAEEAIGGNTEALQTLRELITFPLLHPCESQKLGLRWRRGLLLYGPSGTGKGSLVRAVVRECDAHLTLISSHSVRAADVGEGVRILQDAFDEASSHAKLGKPSVIYINEIHALCPRCDFRRDQEISQLFRLMDSNELLSKSVPHVVVVASTNRVDSIDPALRRPGRLDVEIEVPIPSEEERFHILKIYAKEISLDTCVDLRTIAAFCNGYVGADLEALCNKAVMCALQKSSEAEMRSLTLDDWKYARSVVRPIITRDVIMKTSKVSWEDIGGLKDIKKKLQEAVEWPFRHFAFSNLGISSHRGILLHGPPGCSKTILAKAAIHSCQVSFFSLSGAELCRMHHGEGHALMHNTFLEARLVAPSIIFFEDADFAGDMLVYSFLFEMKKATKGLIVLAATSLPCNAIVDALWRCFNHVIFVPPPDLESRHEILKIQTRKIQMDSDVDLKKIAEDTELFTWAELDRLCMEAGLVALRENISATVVCDRHFQAASKSFKPYLTVEEVNSYAKDRSLICSSSKNTVSSNKLCFII